MLINGEGYNLWPEVLKDLYKQGLRSKIYPYSTGPIRGGYELDKPVILKTNPTWFYLLFWRKRFCSNCWPRTGLCILKQDRV